MMSEGEVICGYEVHPLCAVLPDMPEDEFAALVESIRAGYDKSKPVILYEGKILDGRHRARACKEAEVTFPKERWDGSFGSPEHFVNANNVTRRHLTEIQRKAVAVRLLLPAEREAAKKRMEDRTSDGNVRGGNAHDLAAHRSGLKSGRMLPDLEAAIAAKPEVYDAIMSGKIKTVAKAQDVAGTKRKKSKPKQPKHPLDAIVALVKAASDADVQRMFIVVETERTRRGL